MRARIRIKAAENVMVRKQQNRLVKNHGTITKRRQYNYYIAGKAEKKNICKESASKSL